MKGERGEIFIEMMRFHRDCSAELFSASSRCCNFPEDYSPADRIATFFRSRDFRFAIDNSGRGIDETAAICRVTPVAFLRHTFARDPLRGGRAYFYFLAQLLDGTFQKTLSTRFSSCAKYVTHSRRLILRQLASFLIGAASSGDMV